MIIKTLLLISIFLSTQAVADEIKDKLPQTSTNKYSEDLNTDAAKLYSSGILSKYEDITKAVMFFEEASNLGHFEAKYELAKIYDTGNGVEVNKTKAFQLFSEVLNNHLDKASKGDVDSYVALGKMYASGYGTSEDITKAVYWYELAAKKGNISAQNSLGFLYGEGRGVIQDYKQSYYWHRKAAVQGYTFSQLALSLNYAFGFGVKKDPVKSQVWILIAKSQGADTSDLDNLNKLTLSQIHKAQEIAKKCVISNYKQCNS